MTGLQDKLADLLAAHLAEQGGGIVTAFHLAVEYVNADGADDWLYVNAPDQRQSRTLGLLYWSVGVVAHDQQRYLDRLDED